MTPLLVEGNALAAMTLMIALSAPAGEGHDDRLGRELPYTA